jgi:hypothetical protein
MLKLEAGAAVAGVGPVVLDKVATVVAVLVVTAQCLWIIF